MTTTNNTNIKLSNEDVVCIDNLFPNLCMSCYNADETFMMIGKYEPSSLEDIFRLKNARAYIERKKENILRLLKKIIEDNFTLILEEDKIVRNLKEQNKQNLFVLQSNSNSPYIFIVEDLIKKIQDKINESQEYVLNLVKKNNDYTRIRDILKDI